MANRSDLSARVPAILDSTQARGRLALVPAVAVALTIVVLTAAIAPVRAVGRSIEGSAASPTSTASQGGQGRRVSALDRALYEAAEQGDLEDIGALLGAGANVNGVVLGDGSPLIGAARSGKVAAVTLLLDRGADPNLIVEGDGSPLIMAAREGHEEIVDLLLKRGAIIDQVAPGDENALIQASAEGQLRVVRLLVARGANVNARVWVDRSNGQSNIRRGEYRTPLGMARQERHEAVVAYLLSVGARN
jgi:ankyrin repeat protein